MNGGIDEHEDSKYTSDEEKMASLQHDIWNHWMKYMFSCGSYNDDGSWTMPADKVMRWKKQSSMLYSELTQIEQQSDIDVIRKFKLCK